MGLKFRRGTTAQKSGSLAFGEPYVNTDLGTLQIGGASGDITLGSTGTGSTGAFGAISGSGLDITGNANIGGNLTIGGQVTIGDNTSDSVNVVASLSSSLIPQTTNVFDLGSATKIWKDLYISTGSIKFVDPGTNTVVGTLSSNAGGDFKVVGQLSASSIEIASSSMAEIRLINNNLGYGYHLQNTAGGNFSIHNSNTNTSIFRIDSGSSPQHAHFFGDLVVTGSLISNTRINAPSILSSFTGSFTGSVDGIGNVTLYSSSVASRLVAAESFSSSLDTTFATDASVTSLSSSVKAVTDTFATSASVASATAASITSLSSSVKAVTDTFATSASLASARATDISTISGSVKTVTDALSGRVTTLEGKDISITLTGDVTGTGTITDLANVSFATTIAANSVALGTDTTGDYVASLVAGTAISVGAAGEGATPTITNTGVTSNVAGTGVSVSSATGAVTISIGQAVATSDNVRFNSLGVGMAASATAGRIDAAGDVVAFSSSDKNFKENITPIENPIEKIRKISGNTYDWKADLKDVHGYEGNDVGVIAQEIEAVLPQIVTTRENGYKAVKYEKLVALLIEGIKAQQNQIDSLTIEIENLKKNNSL